MDHSITFSELYSITQKRVDLIGRNLTDEKWAKVMVLATDRPYLEEVAQDGVRELRARVPRLSSLTMVDGVVTLSHLSGAGENVKQEAWDFTEKALICYLLENWYKAKDEDELSGSEHHKVEVYIEALKELLGSG